MKQLTGNQVRQMFLDFFKSKGHMIEPGASLVPHNDPTLLWINAGVAALKKYFDGSEKPRNNRIANAQKSIRTNDIENVGKTARHHTFFEMLGNFSIGDYFKEDAIPFAYEFLTSPEWIGFPKEKLYVSVYTDDTEAYRIWTEVCKFDPSHILKTDGNFWEIGEGPGGPDSEIFFDRGEKYDPEGLGEKLFFEELENDRYIEVWNVVFSQYDCKPELDRSEYKELPQKNIDTGMGLERLVCLVQEGETNFDTDLFLPLIHECEKYTKYAYTQEEYKMAFRVIADHIRTVTFALADGALFSNEGRGYVLRRVLRRAVRFGKKLKIEGAFMYKLVPVVYELMKDFYPYVGEKLEYIAKLVKAEEERFHTTLSDGEKLMLDVMDKNKDTKLIDGATAFKLYDTYGFPLELTIEMAQESDYRVDENGFQEEMAKQRERARNAREEAESMSSQSADLMAFTKESAFIGYDQTQCHALVIGLFKDGKQVESLDSEGDVIFDQSVCYGESGGQIGDSGSLHGAVEARILQTIKAPHKQHLHRVSIDAGKLHVGDEVEIVVDEKKRDVITRNHSCTHLLQSALKEVVGTHIQQAGSFVSDEYLRFDFTHFEKVSEAQLNEIEGIVNQFIAAHYEVRKVEMPIEEAKKSGATALFDEKYGDVVRVVSMGDVSKEFCGGCHVHNTQEIGVCKIVSEESIGSGIRRITAKTGFEAYQEFHALDHTLHEIAADLKMNGITNIENRVVQVLDENAQLKKEIAALQASMFALKANDLQTHIQSMNGKEVLIERMDGVDANALKDIVTNLKAKYDNLVVFLGGIVDDKVVFVAGAGKEAVSTGVKCGDLVREAALICDGKGGGRPDLAQSGAKDTSKIEDAFAFIKNILS
ncbi:alanine--tRNA ligase [Amedibacillus sp. YH-ame10]